MGEEGHKVREAHSNEAMGKIGSIPHLFQSADTLVIKQLDQIINIGYIIYICAI